MRDSPSQRGASNGCGKVMETKQDKGDICEPSTVQSGKHHPYRTCELACGKCSIKEVVMRPRHIMIGLVVLALVSTSNSSVAADDSYGYSQEGARLAEDGRWG